MARFGRQLLARPRRRGRPGRPPPLRGRRARRAAAGPGQRAAATAGRGNPDLAPPSAEFPLGTDEIGRSVLAQLIWGARISLFIGVVATIVAVVIGSAVGVTPASSAAAPSGS